QAGILPAQHLVVAGMDDVGIEARLHLRQRLVVVAEERRIEAVRMGLGEGGIEIRQLVTAPGEVGELVARVRAAERGTGREERRGDKAQAGAPCRWPLEDAVHGVTPCWIDDCLGSRHCSLPSSAGLFSRGPRKKENGISPLRKFQSNLHHCESMRPWENGISDVRPSASSG